MCPTIVKCVLCRHHTHARKRRSLPGDDRPLHCCGRLFVCFFCTLHGSCLPSSPPVLAVVLRIQPSGVGVLPLSRRVWNAVYGASLYCVVFVLEQTPVQQRHVQLLGRSVDLTHRVSGAMNRKIGEVGPNAEFIFSCRARSSIPSHQNVKTQTAISILKIV